MHGDEGVQEGLGVQVDQLGKRVKIRGYGQLQGAAGSLGGQMQGDEGVQVTMAGVQAELGMQADLGGYRQNGGDARE